MAPLEGATMSLVAMGAIAADPVLLPDSVDTQLAETRTALLRRAGRLVGSIMIIRRIAVKAETSEASIHC